ncbi:hypothetical protein [Klebsiella phage phiKp_32]|uniref:Uncharacterized protein n=2 Tax=root TaxID=1 RepID=A0A873WV92_9CAUD|nr:hypothetical protein PQB86_gp289 [Klebsiella phage Miami]QPB09384.1 hypothetical protein CPT_Miami_289 [Klebsiella phage Miami]WNY40979.1 hypothetical protein [Klebsiella phage YC1]WPH68806.1 hypothetical protein [Stenotrophomonas phage BUCTxx100]BEH89645.1 hypothetical protein [Klebsiella phage phiKp_32]
MTGFCVATMSTLGFIADDVKLAMDRHLTYWFASRRDQNKLIGEVDSFEYLLMTYQGNRSALVSNVESSLRTYFQQIFSTVEVQVSDSDMPGETENFTLVMALRVTHEGVPYDLQNAVIVSGASYTLLPRGN